MHYRHYIKGRKIFKTQYDYFIKKEGDIIKHKWRKRRSSIDKFFRLKNGQWLKIFFSYYSKINVWFVTIVVANSKRQCNDCLRKTEKSPKVFYGRKTGNKLGLEAFRIALKELLKFEKTVNNTEVRVVGASERLNNIYKYLKRYGYTEHKYNKFGKETSLMFKNL